MKLPIPIRRPLEGERFQVIVIGGGINGVAIARECARAGRRTLLVEQHDFASGTTSRSTRLIHGGLRYLEHGEIGLVRESLREQGRLLRERPHLVQPVHFLLAMDSNSTRNTMAVRTGLWLYSRMKRTRSDSNNVRSYERRLERTLDAGRQWSLFNFEDAQCEFPERLVAELLTEAVAAGAVVRNHTEVLAVDVRSGRAMGALLRDRLSGREEHIAATWVINAAGPWVDRLCQRSRVRTPKPMIGGVRGSHIVLPRFPGAPETAVHTEALDGRPIFVIPWNEQVLLGTTEVADQNDPAKAEASGEEIDYLLRSLHRLFPKVKLSQHDIRYSIAGVRPLPFSPQQPASHVTRRHFLHDHSEDGVANMISVIGGKLSTAASLARECVGKMGIKTGQIGLAMASTEDLDPQLADWILEIAQTGAINESSASAIVAWHGRRAAAIAQLAKSGSQMRASLCPHNEHIVAEAVDAFTNECAVTLADVLLRRVPVALGPCWSEACGRAAALRVGAALGWTEAKTAAELETFEVERSAFLRKPARFSVLLESAAD